MADEVEFMDRKKLKEEVVHLRSAIQAVKQTIQEWLDKQKHDRCWYYPDLFRKLVDLMELKPTREPCLPPRDEFELGCLRYQEEEFGPANPKFPLRRGDKVQIKATGEVYEFWDYGYSYDYRHKDADPDVVWVDDGGMYFIRFYLKDVEGVKQ